MKDSTLQLSPTYQKRLLHCNIIENGNSISFKRKIVGLDKPLCKQRMNFSLISGRKTYRLHDKDDSFKGELSTKSLMGYELNIDLLESKNSLILHHSLHKQDYQRLSTMTYEGDSYILPGFGLMFRENNDIASPFISLKVAKEVFISQKDVNTLSIEDKFVTSMNLGYEFKMDSLKLSPSARLSSHGRGANLEMDYSFNRRVSLLLRAEYNKRDTGEERGATIIGLRLKD